MSNTTKLLGVLGVAFAATIGTAQAQATRTWVSGVGDDVNPCSRTAPCKTFAGAISKTATGGEINCLDPGGFGSLTITKSITIDCIGTLGSTLHSLVTGFVINAAGGKVILRNLSVNGSGTTIGTNSVNLIAAAHVLIENVTFSTSTNGINTASLASTSNLQVRNATFTFITNAAINMRTTTGFAIAQVTNSTFQNTGTGVQAGNNGFVTVSNSNFLQNTTGAQTTGTGKLNVDSSLFTNNTSGVVAAVGTTVNVASNALYDNTNGFVINGTMLSDGRNRVVGATANPPDTLPLN
jgi:hypothetical protein